MFDRQKFMDTVRKSSMTLDAVASRLTIDDSTLYRKTIGVSDFTRAEIQELRQMLSLTAEDAEAIFFAEQSA